MLSIAPRGATLPPVGNLPAGHTPLRNAFGVANKVLWPCGRAVWSATWLAPVRAIALLGWALGLRHAKRRPMARKISGCATSHGKPLGRNRNLRLGMSDALGHVGHHLNHALADFTGWLHSLAELAPAKRQGEQAQTVEVKDLVQPGSHYQNDYMTLWNDSNSTTFSQNGFRIAVFGPAVTVLVSQSYSISKAPASIQEARFSRPSAILAGRSNSWSSYSRAFTSLAIFSCKLFR
mmetsp:Transcript_6139/g.6960  ORF Transcript_6139/g.6960 Transcript_6139/m.6960 type:complete len:235 (+) Transcript_6139:85-789(+)